MNKKIKDRVLEEADYIINTNQTIREMTKVFRVSKSTIHKDLNERLININHELYEQIKVIFEEHIKVRHINGGESTRQKYLKINNCN